MKTIILWSRDNPIKVLIFLILVSVFSLSRIPHVKIDPTIQKMLSKDHPERKFYLDTEFKFTSDVITSIYIKDKNLFTPEKINLLEKLSWKLSEIKEIYKVDSLFNSPNFYNDGGILSTVPLFDPVPDEQEELDKLLDIGLGNPLYINQFLSPDKQSMTIVLYAEKGNHDVGYYERLANNVDKELKPLKTNFETIFQIGIPRLSTHVIKGMTDDQITLIPLAILIVCLLLLVGLKSLNASLLPILTGTLSVLWTMAFMTLLGIEVQILISTIPIILFIIGSTEDCHMISEYLEGLHIHKNRNKAIHYMAKKVGLAITLTTITTVIGFLSITINKIVLLKEFAIIASAGLALNFFVTALLTPIYLRFLGEKTAKFSEGSDGIAQFYHKLSHFLLDIAKNHRTQVFFGFLIILSIAGWLATTIHTDIDNLAILKKSDPFLKKIDKMNENYKGGINNLLIVFKKDGDKPFKKSQYMKKIFQIHNHINDSWKDGMAQSLSGTLALINREMNEGKKEEYRIPDRDDLIAQYMLFLSKDDWEPFITPDYKEVNIIVRHKLSSSVEVEKIVNRLSKDFKKILEGTGITFKFTSAMIVQTAAAKTLVDSQIKGIFLILGCIFIIIWILFLDLKAAALSMIPNIVPIIGLFGFMGLFNIPLDIGTSIIATIAIGVATDDTLHFFTRYNDCMKEYEDVYQAMRHTIQEEIKPVMTTSISLAIGLGILGLSNFKPIIEFGVLASITMLLALFSDLVVTPMMLLATNKKEFVSIIDIYSSSVQPKLLKSSAIFQKLSYKTARSIFLMGKSIEYSPDDHLESIEENEVDQFLLTHGTVIVEKVNRRSSEQNSEEGSETDNVELLKLGPGTIISKKRFTQPVKFKIEESISLLQINNHFLKRVESKDKEASEILNNNINHINDQPLI